MPSSDDESRPVLVSTSRREARLDDTGKRWLAEGNYEDFRQRELDCCSSGCQWAFVEFLSMRCVLL
jgi:hypothetical protein